MKELYVRLFTLPIIKYLLEYGKDKFFMLAFLHQNPNVTRSEYILASPCWVILILTSFRKFMIKLLNILQGLAKASVSPNTILLFSKIQHHYNLLIECLLLFPQQGNTFLFFRTRNHPNLGLNPKSSVSKLWPG